jgi:hypothetical protein
MSKRISALLPINETLTVDQSGEYVLVRRGDDFLRLTELEALKLRLENTIRYLSQLSKDQAALLGDLEAEAVINALAPNNWFFPEQPDEVPCPCVYFIHFPHYNSVKIGYTEDLAQRGSLVSLVPLSLGKGGARIVPCPRIGYGSGPPERSPEGPDRPHHQTRRTIP